MPYAAAMRIQKSLFASIALLFAAFLSLPALAADLSTATTNKHCLWKVSGPTSTVYLLGSIHLLKKTDYPLDPVIETAFTNSRIAAFETDMAKMESPETMLSMMGKVMLPSGETLEDHLTPTTYALFTNHVNKSGLPLIMFNQMKPLLAVTALAVMELKKLGLEPEYGVDKYFSERATKEKKRLVPLETVEFQINLLTGFSKEENELVAKTSLADMDKMLTEFKDIISAWKTGDSSQLEKFLNEATQQSPAIFKRLLTDRNHNWIPKIEEFLAGKENAIVIVGAGHLVGKEGVVDLLQKKGLKVTQL